MLDLTDATNCIASMKENRTYRGEKIGRLRESPRTLTPYREGEIVLFREEIFPEPWQTSYKGIEPRPTGCVTIEKPMSAEWIAKEKGRGSLLTTIGTVVGVPAGYVEEIRI